MPIFILPYGPEFNCAPALLGEKGLSTKKVLMHLQQQLWEGRKARKHIKAGWLKAGLLANGELKTGSKELKARVLNGRHAQLAALQA